MKNDIEVSGRMLTTASTKDELIKRHFMEMYGGMEA
jgi:hypothetical protein